MESQTRQRSVVATPRICGGCGVIASLLWTTLVWSPSVFAQEESTSETTMGVSGLQIQDLWVNTSTEAIASLMISLGVTAFAVVCAIMLLRARTRLGVLRKELNEQLVETRARADRAEALLGADDAAIIGWDANGRAQLSGTLPPIAQTSRDVAKILDFAVWLKPSDANNLGRRLAALRGAGEGFNVTAETLDDEIIEADGRARGGKAVLRLRKARGDVAEAAQLRSDNEILTASVEAIQTLFERTEIPVWAIGVDGTVTWSNPAADNTGVVLEGSASETEPTPLLEKLRDPIPQSEDTEPSPLRIRQGDREQGAVLSEIHASGIRWGVAAPHNDPESDQGKSRGSASLTTLNQLRAGVAMFDADQRLVFANMAFQDIFQLESEWVLPGVAHSQILDVLHEAQSLPPESDFKAWKARTLSTYHATETDTETWLLPDGRTLRVVSEPTAEGGVTCIFEDQTERLSLETEFKSFMRVQRETLENMNEAVAVFKSDGRLDYFNPSFTQLWDLNSSMLRLKPHVQRVAEMCTHLYDDDTIWTELRHAVTDVDDHRSPVAGRMERSDDRIIEYSTVPLPQGATLVTYVDVSDQIQKERVLRERNDALETAAKLKNDFIQHVSYELRTPLTSVIGFAELMARTDIGPLSSKQAEYVGHILSSSQSLLAIIDNILDLATVDAGVVELDFQDVEVINVVREAAEGVRDRLEETGVKLHIRAPRAIGSFKADPSRLRQILFNLLSNAVGFSERGQTVQLTCERQANSIQFIVTDNGRGMTPAERRSAFDRFVTRASGTSHRGAGLGLSIVESFVKLHNGTVELMSEEGEGTTVTCTFPADQLISPDRVPESI